MSTQNLDLSGKTALVTGGSRGIGRAIATLLAARGASVAVTYSSSADAAHSLVSEVEKAGGKAFAVQADASDKAAVRKGVVDAVTKLGGKLDVLVNNAGLFEMGTVADLDDAKFDKQLDVNVRGVWFTTQAAAEHMNDGGRIINIGSVVGEHIPFPGGSAYGMTKHAVAGLTKGWTRDFAPRGITVNVIEPGPIDTEMNPDTAGDPMSDGMRSMVPLGRYGRAEEVAELAAFLASPAAAYISGAHIAIDGGMLA